MMRTVCVIHWVLMHMTRNVCVRYIFTDIQRLVRKQPKILDQNRMVINLMKTCLSVVGIAFGIVVTFNQKYRPVKLRKHFLFMSFRSKISQVPYDIVRRNSGVPALNHSCIHFQDIFEGTVFVSANLITAKMSICYKEYSLCCHMSHFFT